MSNEKNYALPLLLTCLLVVAACGRETGQAPPTASASEAGVPTAVIEFVEDLRLSPASGEDHLVWTGADIEVEVDGAGNMFVVDSGGNRILQFDAAGQFVRQIGRQGEGPGEFQALKRLSLLDDGTAIVLEQIQSNSSLSYFDKDMNFVRKESLTATQQVTGEQKLLRTAEFSPDGQHISAVYIQVDPNNPAPVMKVGLLSRDMNTVRELKEMKIMGFNFEKADDLDWWSDFLAPWFQAFREPGLIAFGRDGTVYTSQGGVYEIARWSPALEPQATVTREYQPFFQSEEDIFTLTEPIRSEILATFPPDMAKRVNDDMFRRAIEKAELPPRQMPIIAIIPMDDGGFLAAHSYNAQTGAISADVFDKTGAFLGAASLPKVWVNACGGFYGDPVKMTIRNGYAYALENGEQGDLSLVRYKYTVNSKP